MGRNYNINFKPRQYFKEEENRKFFAPFISIVLGFLAGAILMLILFKNPFLGYFYIFKGGLFGGMLDGDFSRLGNTLSIATILTFTGLAVAFAFKSGLFNLGVSGQMLVGGFIAVYLGNVLTLPKPLHITVCVLAAVIAGAIWASVPGILKAKFRINEVVVSIMMNYIAVWSVKYFVLLLIPSVINTESSSIKSSASLRTPWLNSLFDNSSANIALFLAFITVFALWFILEKTTFGYELKSVGYNQDASKYAGMNVSKNIVLSMIISGAIAGLAGASYYLGYMNHIKVGVLPAYGFDGIAVSLLGLNQPLGVMLAAFLFGILRTGGEYLTAAYTIPVELVDIIRGLIIYFAATSLLIQQFLKKYSNNQKIFTYRRFRLRRKTGGDK